MTDENLTSRNRRAINDVYRKATKVGQLITAGSSIRARVVPATVQTNGERSSRMGSAAEVNDRCEIRRRQVSSASTAFGRAKANCSVA